MKPRRGVGLTVVSGLTAAGLVAAGLAAAGLAVAQTPPVAPPAPQPAPAAPAAPVPDRPAEEPPPPAAEVPRVLPTTPAAPPSTAQVELTPAPEADEKPEARSQAPKAKAPAKKVLHNAAILQALDKVTAETLRFEAPLNRPIRYKGLIITVHTCVTAGADARPPASAHMMVASQPVPLPGRAATPPRNIFRGWMFAEAPGLNPFEHPVYDVWLVACKNASTGAKAGRR